MTALMNHYPAYMPTDRAGLLVTLEDVGRWRGVYQGVLRTLLRAGAQNEKAIKDCEQHLAMLDLAEKQLTREAR